MMVPLMLRSDHCLTLLPHQALTDRQRGHRAPPDWGNLLLANHCGHVRIQPLVLEISLLQDRDIGKNEICCDQQFEDIVHRSFISLKGVLKYFFTSLLHNYV